MPTLFVPKETSTGETRVAATPETVKALIKSGLNVTIESGAGTAAHFSDDQFSEAGAHVVHDREAGYRHADIVLRVSPPTPEEALLVRENSLLFSFLAPHRNAELVRTFRKRKISAVAMELIPRTTKAQSMDALSSQANIAGYKAVLVAAARLGKYFPLLMTAAGTIPPARVVIMGAGVAGLQALATAKRLGAIVEVSDIRPVVREQVLSLGGRFIDLPEMESGEGTGGYAREVTPEFLRKQREIVTRHVTAADVVITTAQVPGKKAPMLLTAEMVAGMKPGSVVVDLAVDSGGNCEVSEPDREVIVEGVIVLGFTNLAATTPYDASLVYARNLQALLGEFVVKGEIAFDLSNEIVAGSLLTHAGEIVHAPTAATVGGE
jgi:H+-translocating NAD(P) transhydrogenase subunit alpha